MCDCHLTSLKTAKKGTVIVGKMLLHTRRFFSKRFAEQKFSISLVIFLQEVRNDVTVPFTSLNRKTKKTFPSKPQFSDGLGTCMSNDKKL